MRRMAMELPPGPLVSTEWLARHLESPELRVVDIRGRVMPPGSPPPRYRAKREDYDAGHVPGAMFVDWTKDIVDTDDPIPSQLAPAAKMAATMEALGIGDDTVVVAYDDYSHIFAGRLRWALRAYGHEDVRILNGGFATWTREGRPTTTDVPTPRRARFTARLRPELRKTADEVATAITRGALVIDARPKEQYEGRVSAATRAGHIPTARSVPYPTLLAGPDGPFRSDDELREAFAAANIDLARLPGEIIVYCNGGITATVPLTALNRLGIDNVSVYDGSWNEWGNDPTRPLESGSSS